VDLKALVSEQGRSLAIIPQELFKSMS
jgi:hypothetical protein